MFDRVIFFEAFSIEVTLYLMNIGLSIYGSVLEMRVLELDFTLVLTVLQPRLLLLFYDLLELLPS